MIQYDQSDFLSLLTCKVFCLILLSDMKSTYFSFLKQKGK